MRGLAVIAGHDDQSRVNTLVDRIPQTCPYQMIPDPFQPKASRPAKQVLYIKTEINENKTRFGVADETAALMIVNSVLLRQR
jgi:hypothetical protein